MGGRNMNEIVEEDKISIRKIKDELSEFYNDELCAGDKQFLQSADEYAYRRYGISAVDIICGGDVKEFFTKWYDEKIGIEGIQKLIDERADKYGLTGINELILFSDCGDF